MDFLDLLLKRRSVRKYSDEEISKKDLDLILKAGLLAPTGRNLKSCMFLVVENKKTLEKLSSVKDSGSGFLKDANKAIVVIANPLVSDTWIEDSSIALGYMHLMAANLDVGSCWVQVRLREANGVKSEDLVREILGIDDFYSIVGILGLGIPYGEVNSHKLDDIDKNRVHFLFNLKNK